MKLNLLDRAIAAFDPVRAAQRARARAQLTAFSALGGVYPTVNGTDQFFGRWGAQPRDAAADSLPALRTLRAQTRELSATHPIAASAISTVVARAIGTGLAYSPQPHLATLGWTADQAEEWCANVKAEHSLWAESPECDWAGESDFYDLTALAVQSMLDSGDTPVILPDGDPTPTQPYRLRIQLLEADRVGNPKGQVDTVDVSGGARRVNGRVQAYYVYRNHPGALVANGDRFAGDWVETVGPSGRRRMLMLRRIARPGQPRGIPYLAPVVGLFKQLGTYTDAEIKAAVVSAFLTVFIESDAGAGAPPIFGMADPKAGATPAAGQPTTAGPDFDQLELGPAAIIGLQKGERANAVTPGRPNPAFGAFIAAVGDQLGAGTLIGSEMLFKKFNTSYTAARAAFLDAWKFLLMVRNTAAKGFCQLVTEVWMAEAVATGRIKAPGFFTNPRLRWAYTRAAWHGDSQGSLNPKDEVAAYLAAVEGTLITRERATWELFGENRCDTFPQMVEEHAELAEEGMLPPPKPGAAAPAPGAMPAAEPADTAEPADPGQPAKPGTAPAEPGDE